MFYKKNVDFVELICEDFMYQIDNRQSIAARHSYMPYPRFTKAVIQHFISKDKTISMRNYFFMHGVKNDSVLGFMKFISKYEIRQVYGKLIPDVLVSKEMLESKAYKTYLNYATGKVIPKEARKRKKAHMKETSLIADDNIIPDDPDAAFELAKSISRTEAKEQELARLTSVTIRDTLTVAKKKTPKHSLKLKGMEMLSDATILEEDTRKAIQSNKLKRQDKDTNEEAGSKPEVLDVSKAMSSDQESENESWGDSEDDDDDDHKSDDERTKTNDDKSINLNKIDDEEEAQEDEFVHTPDDYVPTDDETQDVDDEEYEEYVHINEELYGDVNVEIKDDEPADKDKGDEEMTNAEKDEVPTTTTVAPITQKEKTEPPLSSSSHSVSSNYGSIFLNLDNIYYAKTEIMSMLDVQVQQEIPKIQSSSLLTVPVSVIHEPTVLSSIPEIVIASPATTIPPPIPPFIPHAQQSTPIPTPTTTKATTSTPAIPESETLSAIHLRVSDLEKEVKELKNVDHSIALLYNYHYEVSTSDNRMRLEQGSGDALHKCSRTYYKKIRSDIPFLADLKSSNININLRKKQALFKTMIASKSLNNHPKHMALYHALMESILANEDAMDQGVTVKQKKRKPDDEDRDEDPPAGSNQGLKKRKTSDDAQPSKKPKSTGSFKDTIRSQPKSIGKSVQSEETIFKAADTEMPLNQGDDMGDANEQPDVEAVTKDDWFKKPARPPTPDHEWNKGKSVDNKPAQTWLNDLANAE
ncbi:hypothetical protein Tco_0520968 [Tanacetum coccineum]